MYGDTGRNTLDGELKDRKELFWLVLQEQVKHCWRKLLLVKLTFLSSHCQVLTLLRCLLELVHHVLEIYSNKPKRNLLQLFLLMRLMPLDERVERTTTWVLTMSVKTH